MKDSTRFNSDGIMVSSGTMFHCGDFYLKPWKAEEQTVISALCGHGSLGVLAHQ